MGPNVHQARRMGLKYGWQAEQKTHQETKWVVQFIDDEVKYLQIAHTPSVP